MTETAGAPWLLAGGTSESISSPVSIFGRLSDAARAKVVQAYLPDFSRHVDSLRAGSAISLFQQIETVSQTPETVAVLSAGIKPKMCSDCRQGPARLVGGRPQSYCNKCHSRRETERKARETKELHKRREIQRGLRW